MFTFNCSGALNLGIKGLLKSGDHVAFEVDGGKVIVRKAKPIDWAWSAAVGSTLSEWSSEADEEAFRDL